MGIDGNDIREGNKTLTLALVWQLMRAYTLSILKNLGDGHPVVESEIINWANQKASSYTKRIGPIRRLRLSSLYRYHLSRK